MKYLQKALKGIVIGLVTIICILIVKNQFSSLLLTEAEYGMPMLIEKKHIENLFLGSSTFRQGLDIQQIENVLGEDSYILSYNGNQPIMEYYELKNLYEHGVEISKLFVDFYPYTASSSFKISDTKIFLETNIQFKNEIATMLLKENNAWGDVWEMYLGANNELLLTWPIAYPLINNRFYKGGNIVETFALEKSELESLEVPGAEALNAIQMEYLWKIIDLARGKGTEIAFVETPKYSTLFLSDSYSVLADEMGKRLEGVKIYRVKESGKEEDSDECVYFCMEQEEYFSDLVHLSSRGREEFTKKMLERL